MKSYNWFSILFFCFLTSIGTSLFVFSWGVSLNPWPSEQLTQEIENGMHNFDAQIEDLISVKEPRNWIEPEASLLEANIEFEQNLSKDKILKDPFSRISKEFQIPELLKKRVGFWYDIYSKYNSKISVIHHVQFPWIVFKTVDTSDIYDGKGHRWTKYHKAKRRIEKEKEKVRYTLRKLALKKSFKNLKGDEKKYYDLLSSFKGRKSKIFLLAAKSIRAQTGQKNYFIKGLSTSGRYVGAMEKIFAQYGLPKELVRLPLVESSFNLKAKSKVGASGIWQFMPGIGKKLMKINERLDERSNPLKSTVAAAKLMKENKQILKKWPLAITAYNHGPGGVKRAIRAIGSDNYVKIISKYNSRHFGFASKNFYSEFLAALYVETYQKEIFGNIEKKIPLAYDRYKLNKKMSIQKIIRICGISIDEFFFFNPDLDRKQWRANHLLPKRFEIHVPSGRADRLRRYLSYKRKKQRLKT